MDTVTLGSSGLRVSRLALGTIPFGSGGGFEKIAGLGVEEARRQLDEALSRGVNFIDTANIYSAGDSERVLGKAMRGLRDDIVLTSKTRSPVGEGPNDSGASRIHVRRSVEASLERLGTDHLDLLYMHQWDGQTPILETIRVANELIREGRIRYWGVSNYNGWQLAKRSTRHGWRVSRAPSPSRSTTRPRPARSSTRSSPPRGTWESGPSPGAPWARDC